MSRVTSLLFIITLTFIYNTSVVGQSGSARLKSVQMRVVVNDSHGAFVEVLDWQATEVVIVIDLNKEKVKIYSRSPQDFDIVKYVGDETGPYGEKWIRYKCVDKDGKQCTIRLMVYTKAYKTQTGALYTSNLFIDYFDVTYQYCVNFD